MIESQMIYHHHPKKNLLPASAAYTGVAALFPVDFDVVKSYRNVCLKSSHLLSYKHLRKLRTCSTLDRRVDARADWHPPNASHTASEAANAPSPCMNVVPISSPSAE